jgi:hypothetical protein
MAKIPLSKLLPLPPGPRLSEEERRRMDAERESRERARPCYGQSYEATKPWMKQQARLGLVIVIRSGIGMSSDYDYLLDEVVELHPSNRFFYTAAAISYKALGRGRYYYSGQSMDDPKGQVDLLVPAPQVVIAAINTKPVFARRPANPALVARAVEQTRNLFGVDITPHVRVAI